MSNRYMRKPYRCNICFRSFDTVRQAEKHWLALHEDGEPNRSCPQCGTKHRLPQPFCSPTCRDIAYGFINPDCLPGARDSDTHR
jgi:hypothetical protein